MFLLLPTLLDITIPPFIARDVLLLLLLLCLALIASFSVLTRYYMQGSAADIIKVAMLNSHSVITIGSNTVDSMDGLTQNF